MSDRKMDAAEEWLAKHDRQYKTRKREWHTPSTDVLEFVTSERNAIHSTLQNLEPVIEPDMPRVLIEGSKELRIDVVAGAGNYRHGANVVSEDLLRRASLDEPEPDSDE